MDKRVNTIGLTKSITMVVMSKYSHIKYGFEKHRASASSQPLYVSLLFSSPQPSHAMSFEGGMV
jgi:hypothetical protein